MAEQAKAMVVGASRGLGLALAEEWCERGWRVITTVRGRSKELETLASRYPGNVEIETVDIAKADTVKALRARLEGRRVDVLFINAGIARAINATPASVDEQDFLDMMLTNALSPARGRTTGRPRPGRRSRGRDDLRARQHHEQQRLLADLLL